MGEISAPPSYFNNFYYAYKYRQKNKSAGGYWTPEAYTRINQGVEEKVHGRKNAF